MTQRILVVEDSPTQAQQLRALLAAAGYAVEVANDGVAGWKSIQASPPDLVVSDVLMPRMDGYELCRTVKARAEFRSIPFVLLTRLNTTIDVLVGLECGADNFITKPFSEEYLINRVQRILENAAERRGGTKTAASSTVSLGERQIPVSADKQQIVELLVAILEEMGKINDQLVESQRLVEGYHKKLQVMERTRRALEADRVGFTLFYQPILDLRTGQVAHFEALLRMAGEAGTLVPPGEFLPLAEQTGVIHQIDRWVCRRAIGLLASQVFSDRASTLAVNLSARSLANHDLLMTIADELARTGVAPQRITFEITETSIMSNIEQGIQFIEALHQIGCKIALDDFGVGYSSFEYLRSLPVDYVKIDGSFIRDITTRVVDQHVVKAIVDVAHALGMETVAEFVSSEESIQILRDLGVDFAQGYYVGRPSPEMHLRVRP